MNASPVRIREASPGVLDIVARRLPLPDFIIGGAPRSGTSFLSELCGRHPGLDMAKPARPEPKFFIDEALYSRGLDYYSERWFKDLPKDGLLGEKSTNYLENAAAATRIKSCLPDVKLIFILRRPEDRAYSNYLWSRMNGLEEEDFRRALDLEEERENRLGAARPHAYFSRGLYAQLLAPYFEVFPREQILCLRYEDIATDAGALAARIHAFLGVEARPKDVLDVGVVNPSEKDLGPIPENIRAELQERFAAPNRKLVSLLGGDFEGWDES